MKRLVRLNFLRLSGSLSSQTARNAISSFIALGWLSLLSLITIPIYIRILGVSEWGLVAACASLQIFSNFIDAGFSQIVPRWAAQESQHPARLRRYVVLFQRLYVALGLTMFVMLQASAGYLAHQWFQVQVDRAASLELAIRIVSFQFLFQFVNNLNVGLWHGLQHQVQANVRACFFGTLKHASTLLALTVGLQQAWVYALSFAFVACVELCFNTFSVRRMLGNEKNDVGVDKVHLIPLLKEVFLLSGGILVGLLVSQLDRIILSRSVDVSSFGIYTVISTLAFAFLQLQTPITRAYFPLMVRDIQKQGYISNFHMKRLLTGTILASSLPALLAFVFAPHILEFWLRDPEVINVGTMPLRLLLLAVALNSLYGCIYQVIIARGCSQLVLQFNMISLVIAFLVVFFFGVEKGLLLGGVIWISNTITQISLGALWFVKTQR